MQGTSDSNGHTFFKYLSTRKLGVVVCCLQMWRSSTFNIVALNCIMLSGQSGLFFYLPEVCLDRVVIRRDMNDEDGRQRD